MTGEQLFKQGYLPTDCNTIAQVLEWGQAAEAAYGRQSWIHEACENGMERMSTAGDLYAVLVADGNSHKESWAVSAMFAMTGEEETDDMVRWLDAQAVDEAQGD